MHHDRERRRQDAAVGAPASASHAASASSTTPRIPSRRRSIGNAVRIRSRARRAASGPELERAPDAAGDLVRLLRLDQHAGVADHLGHRRHVHHHRHAAGQHRLGDRQAEALVARGLHVDGGAPVGRVQVLVREPAGELDVLAGAARAARRPRRRATCRRTRSARRAARARPRRTGAGPSARAWCGRWRPRSAPRAPSLRGASPNGSGTPWWTTRHARGRDRRVALDLAEAVARSW